MIPPNRANGEQRVDVFVALLRAVNVGGTGTLTMSALAALCEAAGLHAVRTVGASGNVVFRDVRGEAEIRAALAERLQAHAGRAVGVIVRPAAELEAVLARNPFPAADPARVMALFVDAALPDDPLAGASGHAGEEVRAGHRELFVFYPRGAGASRLRLPAERAGTARNMNTVARLAALSRKLGGRE